MKKLLPFLSLSFLTLAACNQSNTAEQPVVSAAQQVSAQPDTAGLAAYHAWKAQNELAPVAASYTQNAIQPAQPQEPKTRVIYRTVPEKRAVAKAPVRSSTKSTAPASSGSSSSADEGSGSISNESAQTAKVEEKKKMSAQTKGTIIGAAGGAAAGAIINKKNRVVGAVIGGVAGAIGGRVIGGKIDQRNGG